VRAVAACRFFDVDVYRYLGQVLGIPTGPSDFRTLIAFSFVQQDEQGNYRVHELIRRYSAEENAEVRRLTHEALI
jgi:hypothetical protein